MITLKPRWSRPSTILFATECPPNENAFTFALAQAKESRANLVLLHVCRGLGKTSVYRAKTRDAENAEAQRAKGLFAPLLEHAHELGIQCKAVFRKGDTAEQILNFLQERKVDRVIMGAHTPGPIGKLLVGSVAETLLRRADVPVTIVGPYLITGTYRDYLTRTILCVVTGYRLSDAVVRFAAEIAARNKARLVLLQSIPPQESEDVLAGCSLAELEKELLEMVPDKLRKKLSAEALAVFGDPTEELLYQSQVLNANLIVMDAHEATHFAAVTNASVIYKVLAYAHCPVLTLSPVILAGSGYGPEAARLAPVGVNYLAGVV
jgi:nucleotide-binding universal stress UspA family protein